MMNYPTTPNLLPNTPLNSMHNLPGAALKSLHNLPSTDYLHGLPSTALNSLHSLPSAADNSLHSFPTYQESLCRRVSIGYAWPFSSFSKSVTVQEAFHTNLVTYYVISIQDGTNTMAVRHRYSECRHLYSTLVELEPEWMKDCPPFPKKRLFKFNEDIIQERILMLDAFCRYIFSHRKLSKLGLVKAFFGQSTSQLIKIQ